MKTLVPLGLACIALTGCNAMQNARTEMKPSSIFGPEHTNQMYLGRCNATEKNTLGTCDAGNQFLDSRANFRQASLDASKLSMDGKPSAELKPVVQRYIQSGVAVADMYCEAFFRQITQSAAHRKFLRSETNAIGATTNALLVATEASTGALASSSALFSMLDASSDHYDAAYLVAPNLSDVEKLLEKTQDSYLTSYGNTIEDFHKAQRFLIRYSNNCTFNGIRALVNDSVKSAIPSTDEKSGSQTLNRGPTEQPAGNAGVKK